MRNFILGAIFTGILLMGGVAFAAGTVLFPVGGGTGRATLTSGQLVYGSGQNQVGLVATTTLTPSSSFTTTGTFGYLVGGTNSTFDLSNTGVTAGTYGTSTSTPQLTVDAQGRLSLVANVPIAVPGSKAYYAYATQATSSSAYLNMNPTATTTSTTIAYPLTTSPQTVQNWITPTGDPDVSVIPGGIYMVDLFAWRSSGSASITLAIQIWEVSSTGADIGLIATTNSTPNLSAAKTQYSLFVSTGTYTMASASSRILMRVIATTSGTPTLSLAMGAADQMDLTTPGATVDVTNFVPYTGATANVDLGTFNASSSQLTTSGNAYLANSSGVVGIGATTTPGTLLSLQGVGNFSTATSTITSAANISGIFTATNAASSSFSQGINLKAGCFAIAGVCPTIFTGSGATGQATFWSGATAFSGDNAFWWDNTAKRLGIGTTTPAFPITSVNATGPQISLGDTTIGNSLWTQRAISNAFFLSTTSPTSWATSTQSALALTSNGWLGIGSTTPGSLLAIGNVLNVPSFGTTTLTTAFNVSGILTATNGATSSFSQGINLKAGCFAVAGTCLATGGSGTVTSIVAGTGLSGGTITTSGNISLLSYISTSSAETSGRVPYWTTTGATPASISGGDAGFLWSTSLARFTATNASTTALTSSGSAYFATSNGVVGVATTTPWALFSINPSGIGSIPAFAIGSSTQTWLKTSNGGQTATCETDYFTKYSTSTTDTIDFSKTCNQVLYRTGTSGFTLTITGGTVGDTKRIVVCNPGGTAGAITWASSAAGLIQWVGGTVPTQTTTANKCDVWSFIVSEATSTAATSFKYLGAMTAGF